ncbi:MAG: restriction endonuclease [Patescibacteria group bacterium]
MPKPILVKKASGELESFDPEKVLNSLKRAGASHKLAQDILKIVEAEIYEGIDTREIYQKVFTHLRSAGTHLAARYNLKRALMELGPTGYPFERYFARLLEQEGYQCLVGQQVKGKCVWHEVDVIAEKGKQKYMVEAKYHNAPGLKTDTKVALYVYARFLDVSAGGFTQGWLVTNTKLTRDARHYAECVGLKYLSWDRPQGAGLRELIEKTRLYPVTILQSLSPKEKATLLGEGIVTCRDILKNLVQVPVRKRADTQKEAQNLIDQVATVS